jgi:hypothetical protein
MADVCYRRACCYRMLFDVPSSLCYLHCTIFITPSLYVIGSIAFGRRGCCCARYCCHIATIWTAINVLARSSQSGVLIPCSFQHSCSRYRLVIIKVIFEFVSNLTREQIPLEAKARNWSGSSFQVEHKTVWVKSWKWKAGSEKLEMMVAGCYFWLVRGCQETGIFQQDLPVPSHKLTSNHRVCITVNHNTADQGPCSLDWWRYQPMWRRRMTEHAPAATRVAIAF